MRQKIWTLLYSLIFILVTLFVPKPIYAGGSCNCIGMSCSNNNVNNCTGGDIPSCSGNLGLCGCTCTPPPAGSCATTGQACGSLGCCSGLSCYNPAGSVMICVPSSSVPAVTGTSSTGGKELCSGGTGIDTAIGCIPFTKDQDLAAFFLKWGMGIGGGIATVLIVVASFMISTSQGDPRRLQAGKELLTSAFSGLVLLVFSAFVLNFIGVDILGIF